MPGGEYIIIPRDIRQGRIPHDENREWATSIEAGSALGKLISLFVILAAETIKEVWMQEIKDSRSNTFSIYNCFFWFRIRYSFYTSSSICCAEL
jgi:hypothetical protein